MEGVSLTKQGVMPMARGRKTWRQGDGETLGGGTQVVGAVEDASGKAGLHTVHINTLFRSSTPQPATFIRFWACFGVWNAVFELKEGGR
jgi:hypothetical protein